MKTIAKKITSTALIALLIGSSNLIFAQVNDDHRKDAAPLYNPDNIEQPFLFKFLQDRFFLELLAAQQHKQNPNCPSCGWQLRSLLFNDLYQKISWKLNQLAENEKNNPILQEVIEKWQNPEGNDVNLALKDLYDKVVTIGNFPNYLDSISIELMSKSAAGLDMMSQTEFKDRFMHAFLDHQNFISKNFSTLKRIEEIVDNGFKIEVETSVSEQQWREIHSLSEIMPYVLIMKEKEADIKTFLLAYYIVEGIHERYAKEDDSLSSILNIDLKEAREAFSSLKKPLLMSFDPKKSLSPQWELASEKLALWWCSDMYNQELNTLFDTHLSPTSTEPFLESNRFCHTSYQDALKKVRAIRDKYNSHQNKCDFKR